MQRMYVGGDKLTNASLDFIAYFEINKYYNLLK